MLKRIGTGEQDEKEMSFLDHLEELRWTLVRSVAAVIVCAIVIYLNESWVFDNIVFGPKKEHFPTYQFFCNWSDVTCIKPKAFEVLPREMGEQFFTSLVVSFWLGLVVAFPFVFYQIWSFIKPGLYDNEQKSARGTVFICSLLFSMGVIFGYYIIAPFAVNFLAGYSLGPEIVNSTSLKSYVNYMVMFCIPTGILFELPVIVYFLASIGLVTAGFMKTYRKHAIVIILVLSAMITPPDIVTQVLIGIPVLALYEVSIYIAGRAEKKRNKELAQL